jgi:hypothetical protein
MEQIKLIDYLKSKGAVKAAIVKGANGDFISATKEGFVDRATTPQLQFTLPVGKNSQGGRLAEMNVLLTQDNQDPNKEVAIATMNNYMVIDSMELV